MVITLLPYPPFTVQDKTSVRREVIILTPKFISSWLFFSCKENQTSPCRELVFRCVVPSLKHKLLTRVHVFLIRNTRLTYKIWEQKTKQKQWKFDRALAEKHFRVLIHWPDSGEISFNPIPVGREGKMAYFRY